MGDLKSILVDKRAFMSPRLEYRLRFSVAHEIGHLILHRDIYAGLQHTTAAEWFDYIHPAVENCPCQMRDSSIYSRAIDRYSFQNQRAFEEYGSRLDSFYAD